MLFLKPMCLFLFDAYGGQLEVKYGMGEHMAQIPPDILIKQMKVGIAPLSYRFDVRLMCTFN